MARLRGDGGGARSHHLSAAPNNSSVLLRLTSQPEFLHVHQCAPPRGAGTVASARGAGRAYKCTTPAMMKLNEDLSAVNALHDDGGARRVAAERSALVLLWDPEQDRLVQPAKEPEDRTCIRRVQRVAHEARPRQC